MEDDEDKTGLQLIPALDSSNEDQASRTVVDADEEIFFLYTISAAEADRRGLGQVDNKNDLLQVTVHLHDASKSTEVCSMDVSEGSAKIIPSRIKVSSAAVKASKGKSSVIKKSNSDTIQVNIRQNSTSLRSTGGDTGSVIWRSSVYLAEKVLRDLSEADRGRKRHASEPAHCIFSPIELVSKRVLELGSGTGILPCLLLSHPYLNDPKCQLQWLATDQVNMLPLLRKNLSSFPRAHVEGLDWVEASKIYQSQSQTSIGAFLRDMMEPLASRNSEEREVDAVYPDLIIATDCIFNPYLFPPFVDTLNLCCCPQKTIVVVVCELREAEAMTEFLQTWMTIGRNGEKWSIHTLEGVEVLGQPLVKGSVVWVAWRTC